MANITQCLHLLHLGDRNRTIAFTALNAHSSRSHAVVMLTVIKRRSVGLAGGEGAEAEIQRVKVCFAPAVAPCVMGVMCVAVRCDGGGPTCMQGHAP